MRSRRVSCFRFLRLHSLCGLPGSTAHRRPAPLIPAQAPSHQSQLRRIPRWRSQIVPTTPQGGCRDHFRRGPISFPTTLPRGTPRPACPARSERLLWICVEIPDFLANPTAAIIPWPPSRQGHAAAARQSTLTEPFRPRCPKIGFKKFQLVPLGYKCHTLAIGLRRAALRGRCSFET